MKKQNIPPFLVLVFLMICTIQAWPAKVSLTGRAPAYANHSLELFTYHDFISEEKIHLGIIRFDARGTFALDADIQETTFCLADFDGYLAMIYLEPGQTYEIVMPPKQELTESQKRNPFFKPEPVWLGILNPNNTELNYRIQKFEAAWAKYENQYFDQIFVNRNKALVDTIKQKLHQEFPKTTSAFFEAHKHYRLANLDFALNQGKSAGFMEEYFNQSKPIYNLSAYSTIFNQVFLNYFDILVNIPINGEIKQLITAGNLRQVDQYFRNKLHMNEELSHLVLLRSLNDAYYSKQFPKSSVLSMLDQVISGGWTAYEQQIARLIKKNLTWLASGTTAPPINLQELNGQIIKLSNYKGTYIYLHFTDPENPICRQHLDVLKNIASHYKDKLTVINVIPKEKKTSPGNSWAGIFTFTNDNIEKIYKVKTVPTSYLIGKDGKLLLSPAPNPIDGLDRQVGQIFKSDYFRGLQKQNAAQPK